MMMKLTCTVTTVTSTVRYGLVDKVRSFDRGRCMMLLLLMEVLMEVVVAISIAVSS